MISIKKAPVSIILIIWGLLEKRVKNVAIAKCLIIQYDKDMNEIARYNSCSEAQRKLGLGEKRYKVIFSALDTNKKAFGYYWKRQ